MSARFLTTWPCQDACGTIKTDELVEGAPVYRCPGCDTTWIELNERTEVAGQQTNRHATDRPRDGQLMTGSGSNP
ncbi:hypothetical protein H5392_03525 [Tessaracoccus sp. MC1865]|uniref:hypothetical protein n=1 Tax=unclassified Tessaracoccus TaxID=2635419 RepID=UPI0016040045|nr:MULTISPECIES: hypothetical protein [unclassified Tessaracoccus]MBB1482929.1 hypothetical protein [Tessaracoccus sp. MC1865]MBB1510522.1 hypothetical protein [Tessaracoccus sp. MC1756]QTO37632.1 hypothetical protein J7D54_00560 [Tessaracoccus sp. MC1865]